MKEFSGWNPMHQALRLCIVRGRRTSFEWSASSARSFFLAARLWSDVLVGFSGWDKFASITAETVCWLWPRLELRSLQSHQIGPGFCLVKIERRVGRYRKRCCAASCFCNCQSNGEAKPETSHWCMGDTSRLFYYTSVFVAKKLQSINTLCVVLHVWSHEENPSWSLDTSSTFEIKGWHLFSVSCRWRYDWCEAERIKHFRWQRWMWCVLI